MTPAFSVVRFSPDPEEVEFINVALLLWRGKHELVVDDGFPKLMCVAPGFSVEVLREYLSHFLAQVEQIEPNHLLMEVPNLSSQFVLLGPRALHDLSDRTIEHLKSSYLSRHRGHHVTTEDRRRLRIESHLESFLASIQIPADRLLRRASPNDFLGGPARDALGNHMRVARVINGATKLVLIEGLDMRIASGGSIQKHAEKIAYNFFRFGKVSSLIQHTEHRELVRATLTFGEANDSDRVAFARALADRDSDVVSSAERPRQEFVDLVKSSAETLIRS